MRWFSGTKRGTAGMRVNIIGMQHADGTVERTIAVYAVDAELGAAAARGLASDLLAAADDLDRLGD